VKELEPSERALLDRGAAELWQDGALVGHLTTILEKGWGSGRPFGTQTFIWLLVTLTNGERYVIEDCPDYLTTPGALAGSLDAEVGKAAPPYEVRWLDGPERELAWTEFGIHHSPGSYRFEGTHEVEWWWSRLLDRMRGRRS